MTEAESALEHIRNRKPFMFGGAEMRVIYPSEFEALLAVAERYRELHALACDDYWAENECACGGRQALAALSAEREAEGD